MSSFRVAFHTVGCRANQADTAWLARRLDAELVEVVPFGAPADLHVVNSCAVTAEAVRDVRRALARARGVGSGRVALLGCMVGACPDEVEALGPLDLVLPSWERERLLAVVHELARAAGRERAPVAAPRGGVPAPLRRARPSLRVQDGCERRCSYCAVPAGRGPERSMTEGQVFEALATLAGEGAREVVVCGVNLGRWGRDLAPPAALQDLVEALEARAPVERIRLSSVEPWTLDARFPALLARSRRIAPHLHLPVQSGDDDVLRRMGRPYRAGEVLDLIREVAAARPGVAVGVDVIAGFPGETDEAFGRTLAFLEAAPIGYLHAFGFSPRPGTRAAVMERRVPRESVRRRVSELRRLGEAKRLAFARRAVGRVGRALLEPARKGADLRRGVTGSFLVAWVPREAGVEGELLPVRIEAVRPDGSVDAKPL